MRLEFSMDSITQFEEALKENPIIGVAAARDESDQQPMPDRVYRTGTAVRVLYMTRAADNSAVLVVHGLMRFRIARWLSDKPYLRAQVIAAPEIVEADIETEALHRSLRDLSQTVFSMSLNVPEEAIERRYSQ